MKTRNDRQDPEPKRRRRQQRPSLRKQAIQGGLDQPRQPAIEDKL